MGTRFDNTVWTGQFTLFYIDFDNQRQDISNDVGWTSLGATKYRGAELAFTYDLSDLYSQLDGAQRILIDFFFGYNRMNGLSII